MMREREMEAVEEEAMETADATDDAAAVVTAEANGATTEAEAAPESSGTEAV